MDDENKKSLREELDLKSSKYDSSYIKAERDKLDLDQVISERKKQKVADTASQAGEHPAEIIEHDSTQETPGFSEPPESAADQYHEANLQDTLILDTPLMPPQDKPNLIADEGNERCDTRIIDLDQEKKDAAQAHSKMPVIKEQPFKTELQKNAENFVLNIEDPDFNATEADKKDTAKKSNKHIFRQQPVQPEANAFDLLSVDEAKAMLRKSERKGKFICFASFISMAAILLAAAASGSGFDFGIPQAFSKTALSLTGAALIGLSLAANLNIIIDGIKAYLKKDINLHTIFAVSAVIIFLQSLLNLKSADPSLVVGSVFALTGFIFQLRLQSRTKKIRGDYRFLLSKTVKQTTDFSVSENADGQLLTARLARCKSVPLNNYFRESYSKMPSEKYARVLLYIDLAVFVAVFIFACFLKQGLSVALSAASMSFFCGLPPSAAMIDHFVFSRVGKRLRRRGAAIIGPQTVIETAGIDEVILGDTDLFGADDVALCGIKIYGDGRIDDIIINAASVFDHLEGPLCDVLLSVIDHKIDLLRPVDEIDFVEGKGIKAFIGNTVVVIGTKKFMRENYLKPPEDGIAEKLENQGKSPLYVACNGEIAALLSLKYEPREDTAKALRQLIKLGMSVKVMSDDPVITADLISEKYLVSALIEVVPKTHSQTEKICERPAVVCNEGQITGFIKALSNGIKLSTIFNINMLIVALNILFGFALVFVMLFSGSFGESALPNMLLLQAMWALPLVIVNFVSGLKI